MTGIYEVTSSEGWSEGRSSGSRVRRVRLHEPLLVELNKRHDFLFGEWSEFNSGARTSGWGPWREGCIPMANIVFVVKIEDE